MSLMLAAPVCAIAASAAAFIARFVHLLGQEFADDGDLGAFLIGEFVRGRPAGRWRANSWRDFTILVSTASSSARLTILPVPRISISRSFNAAMIRRKAPTRILSPAFMASFICSTKISRIVFKPLHCVARSGRCAEPFKVGFET